MEHHFHFSVEHAAYIGLIALLFRYVWKLIAAKIANAQGMFGNLGLAMGGLAQ